MPRSQRSDAELLSAHLAGDSRAFAELYHRHQPQLHRLAKRRSRCAQDAEDAVQDAMLAVHRAAGSFRSDGAVHHWLNRIVANACTERMRRTVWPTTEVTESSAVSPDLSAALDTRVVVRRALTVLPAAQRDAVVAVDLLGYSVSEAAALLGVAEGTVKSRRARARTRLAALLGPG